MGISRIFTLRLARPQAPVRFEIGVNNWTYSLFPYQPRVGRTRSPDQARSRQKYAAGVPVGWGDGGNIAAGVVAVSARGGVFGDLYITRFDPLSLIHAIVLVKKYKTMKAAPFFSRVKSKRPLAGFTVRCITSEKMLHQIRQ